ncbi:YcnI family protein [Galbitalea sp. SE-J8]|uniref:YcnI family copper-binding membrane protein n=1 Tax=Galbitalea sp. SE-J8 TaxID=3054952 RepID=UPI00259C83A7|nr:YcnI family protein [Galbitalea sp. SE-J8]MDM4764098.1 YcnI family protein [Galbitalea sp. SE-J8]
MRNRIVLPAAALGAGLALALAAPLAASAHVTLDDNTAAAGSYALLTFKVPNESATAVTDRLVITLPDGVDGASYVPVPGWTGSVADGAVTFTAGPDAAIADGQLQLFRLSIGPVPDVDSVAFRVEQDYSDGTVVNWSGAPDAEEPAPVLYVNATPPAAQHGGHAATVTADPADAAGTDAIGRVLGIGGLVLGAVALVIALASRRRA